MPSSKGNLYQGNYKIIFSNAFFDIKGLFDYLFSFTIMSLEWEGFPDTYFFHCVVSIYFLELELGNLQNYLHETKINYYWFKVQFN